MTITYSVKVLSAFLLVGMDLSVQQPAASLRLSANQFKQLAKRVKDSVKRRSTKVNPQEAFDLQLHQQRAGTPMPLARRPPNERLYFTSRTLMRRGTVVPQEILMRSQSTPSAEQYASMPVQAAMTSASEGAIQTLRDGDFGHRSIRAERGQQIRSHAQPTANAQETHQDLAAITDSTRVENSTSDADGPTQTVPGTEGAEQSVDAVNEATESAACTSTSIAELSAILGCSDTVSTLSDDDTFADTASTCVAASASSTSSDSSTETRPQPVQMESLEDFEMKEKLGEGSFGIVRLGINKHNGQKYAVKEMKKTAIREKGQDQNVKNERELMPKIDHPFVVRMKGSFDDALMVYVVMEAVFGGHLYALMQKFPSHRFSFDEVRFCAAQMAEAFRFMHSKNIVHRDLKPENVMVDDNGYLKLTDFGFAKQMQAGERTTEHRGTPDYMAPEIWRGAGYEGRPVDWWALGILISEMAQGHTAFYDEQLKITKKKILKEGPELSESLDRRVLSLVHKLLIKDPSRRFGADDVMQHEMFEGMDWEQLKQNKQKSPLLKRIRAAEKTPVAKPSGAAKSV